MRDIATPWAAAVVKCRGPSSEEGVLNEQSGIGSLDEMVESRSLVHGGDLELRRSLPEHQLNQTAHPIFLIHRHSRNVRIK
jgi:hypothetical protein